MPGNHKKNKNTPTIINTVHLITDEIMMTKNKLSAMLLLFLMQGFPYVALSQHKLQDYVNEAIKNNLGLQNQAFQFRKSLYALKEARGLFLPEVEFNTSYLTSGGGRSIQLPIGDLLNPVYSSLNNLTGSNKFPQVENVDQTFNPNNYYDAKVHTTLALYNAELSYNSRIKKEQITLQQAQVDVYKRELVKNVKLAWYGYQQSLQLIKVLENGVVLAKENLRINQAMVKNGKAIRTVVSRSQNELTGLESQLEDARAQVSNSAAYFNFLLNKPLQSPIQLDPDTEPPVQTDTAGGQKREELLAMESTEKVNTLVYSLNRSSALPKLSTFLDLGAQGDFLKVNKDAPYYFLGVTLSWQIFTGNRNRNKAQQALMELRSAQTQTSQAVQQLQLEVETAHNNMLAGWKLYQAAVSQTALSERYFNDEQRLYKEGQVIYLELLDAQTRLINDQIKQTMAYLNVKTRETELERAKASYIF
jgi:outer membrane protein TolC